MEFINLDFTLPSGRGRTLCRFPFPPSSQLDNLVKLHCFQACLQWERRGLDVIRLFTAVHLFLSRGLNLIAPQIFLLIVCFRRVSSSSSSRKPAKTRQRSWKHGGRRAAPVHRGRHFIKAQIVATWDVFTGTESDSPRFDPTELQQPWNYAAWLSIPARRR